MPTDDNTFLAARGLELVREGDLEEALRVGKELLRRRHSSAFEILALVYEQQGDLDRAIGVLVEGVEKTPNVWRLWLILGNLYSCQELFNEAQAAYRSALECPQVSRVTVHMNSATALSRDGKAREALDVLRHIEDPEWQLAASALRVRCLIKLGDMDSAIDLANKLFATEWGEGVQGNTAQVLALLACVLWERYQDPKLTLEYAFQAINLDKTDETAQWLIREINDARSASANYYRLILEGVWKAESDYGNCGFFTNYSVVADNEMEALLYAKQFEPTHLQVCLKIDECQLVAGGCDEPKGVYSASGYQLFPVDD